MALMSNISAFVLALAVSPAAGAASDGLPHGPAKAVAPAQAFVRILPGAKVSLSATAEVEGYRPVAAVITLEDGSRRPARLIEFQ